MDFRSKANELIDVAQTGCSDTIDMLVNDLNEYERKLMQRVVVSAKDLIEVESKKELPCEFFLNSNQD